MRETTRKKSGGHAKRSQRYSRRTLALAAFTAFMILAALTYGVAAFRDRTSSFVASTSLSSPSPPTSAALQSSPQPGTLVVNRAELDRHVVRALNSLGDRFEKPGKERATFLATLTRYTGNDQGITTVQIIHQFPDKLRLEEQTRTGVRVRGFDGRMPWVDSGRMTEEDEKLIETLLRDTIEHFIARQAAGDATRVLGDRYRLDDGSTRGYAGPFYDILKVADTLPSADQTDNRPTLYYLDSDTGLPAKIVYEEQAGAANRIEVEFSNWATAAGQQIPSRVVRKENGVIVLELEIKQAAFGPALPDAYFKAPGR